MTNHTPDIVELLNAVANHDWRVSHLAHTSDTAKKAKKEIERLRVAVIDVNDLDAVVRELGVEDSHLTPAEAIRELKTEAGRLSAVNKALEEALEPFADWGSPADRNKGEVGGMVAHLLDLYPFPENIKRLNEFCTACLNARSALALARTGGEDG